METPRFEADIEKPKWICLLFLIRKPDLLLLSMWDTVSLKWHFVLVSVRLYYGYKICKIYRIARRYYFLHGAEGSAYKLRKDQENTGRVSIDINQTLCQGIIK